MENAGISNVSLAVNSRSEKADAVASTGGTSSIHVCLCDCSCKQTAVLIIRDTGGCIERGSSLGRISYEEADATGVTILSAIISEFPGGEDTNRLRFPLESNDASMARVAVSISPILPFRLSTTLFSSTHVYKYELSPRPLVLHTSRPHYLSMSRCNHRRFSCDEFLGRRVREFALNLLARTRKFPHAEYLVCVIVQ